jgi:hypothetical protein
LVDLHWTPWPSRAGCPLAQRARWNPDDAGRFSLAIERRRVVRIVDQGEPSLLATFGHVATVTKSMQDTKQLRPHVPARLPET